MSFTLTIVPYRLSFRFDARTSRGAMKNHTVYYLILENPNEPSVKGIGECAPLPGLSLDEVGISAYLTKFVIGFNSLRLSAIETVLGYFQKVDPSEYPALRFALETALLDYQTYGSKLLFQSPLTNKNQPILINGLIWMGGKDWMLEQINKKIDEGYNCLKLKIGSLDFHEELEILKWVRKHFPAQDLTLRLDANGAFNVSEALDKLNHLSEFEIHSVEQPIKAGQPNEMAQLCQTTPIPIALDEELIGNQHKDYKANLLSVIKPQYIILKPTLVGGLESCTEWITAAEAQSIPWWITSALESNIGLNCIAQYTSTVGVTIPQGLGTGMLYHNNISSPLTVGDGKLFYDHTKSWDLTPLFTDLSESGY